MNKLTSVRRDGYQLYFRIGDNAYRTNRHGDGVWSVGYAMDRQQLGTCQFSTSHITTISGLRRYIKRELSHWF